MSEQCCYCVCTATGAENSVKPHTSTPARENRSTNTPFFHKRVLGGKKMIRFLSLWNGFDQLMWHWNRETMRQGLQLIVSFLIDCFVSTADDWFERLIDSSALTFMTSSLVFSTCVMCSNVFEHPQMHLHAMCCPAFAYWSFHWLLNVFWHLRTRALCWRVLCLAWGFLGSSWVILFSGAEWTLAGSFAWDQLP